MNPQSESPRIFPSDERFVICANKAGLAELQQKAKSILENGGESITLASSSPDDFSALCLADPDELPPEQSVLTTTALFGILFGIVALLLIGLGTVLSWLP